MRRRTYTSPSGRFVCRWWLGFMWTRMDGRLSAVVFSRRTLWKPKR